MTRVSVDHLRKEFGATVAVEDLSLEIRDGEFFSLLGPSGCGKTTTLNCIAGLEKPTRGNILFDGQVVNDVPPRQREVGFVFQSYALFPHMTVRANLAFALRVRGTPKKEIEREVASAAQLVGVTDTLDRRAGRLSLSQMQKVAIGRTLLSKPKVLLLDEPLSNLDAQARSIMRTEIKRLQREVGQTAIFVTHDQLEAMTLSDRIAVMSRGKLQQVGTPTEIYNRPKNKFVATFIGSLSINLVDCTLRGTAGAPEFDASTFRMTVPKAMHALLGGKIGAELLLACRPEHVRLFNAPSAEAPIEARILVTESVGPEQVVTSTVKGNGAVLKAVVPTDQRYRSGQDAWLAFDPAKLHVLDKKTEEVLV